MSTYTKQEIEAAGLEATIGDCGCVPVRKKDAEARWYLCQYHAGYVDGFDVSDEKSRAQLAQRDGELETLRGKVGEAVSRSAWAVCPFCGFLNRPYDQKPSADDHKESCPWRPVFAALSENQGTEH